MTNSNYQIINSSIVEFSPNTLILSGFEDTNRIIEKAFLHRKTIIYSTNLTKDFFVLSTGLAGEMLQKLVNYQIKTAFIVNF